MRTFAAALVMLGIAAAATAQTRPLPTRAFISVNGGVQVASNDFDDGTTFPANAEEGRYATDYSVEGGPSLNVGGGAMIWRQLGVGVGITRFSRSTPAAFNGSVPHPFFFNRARDIAGDVGGLRREETAVHLRASAVFPAGNRLEVMVFGGPSFFQVKQGIVTDFVFTDEYPYDTATFVRAEITDAEESRVGFNVGGDVGYFFTRQIGIGFALQFARANVELPSAAGGTQELKAGGVQLGGGLRLRF
jgi:hypothetical protein